jgi:hypothetical protein
MLIAPLSRKPLLHVVAHLRERDQRECLSGKCASLEQWTDGVLSADGDHFIFASNDGEPIAAGGWSRLATGRRYAWFVGTEKISSIGVDLHRFGKRMEKAMVDAGCRLVTFCLADGFTPAYTWLERLGYQSDYSAHPWSDQGLMYRFAKGGV